MRGVRRRRKARGARGARMRRRRRGASWTRERSSPDAGASSLLPPLSYSRLPGFHPRAFPHSPSMRHAEARFTTQFKRQTERERERERERETSNNAF